MASLFLGLSLGFGAGITPGPLTTLVVTTALQRGLPAAARVAVAPLLTDLPVVVVAVLAVGAVPEWAFRALGVAGGAFVMYLGVETLVASRLASLTPPDVRAAGDIARGFLTNILSPNPWLFWFAVGAPILINSWRDEPLEAVAFIVGFYGLLVGSKLGIAYGVSAGRGLLTEVAYRRALVAAGVLLLFFGGLLVWQSSTGRL